MIQSMIKPRLALCLIRTVLMVALTGHAAAAETLPPGVVVEEVRPGGVAERVGLEPGDVLLSWERPASPPGNPEPAGGKLRSPFDLLEVELEQAPRGPVTVHGTRAGASLALALPAGSWDLLTRPQLSRADLESYVEAGGAIEQGEAVQGLARWRAMAEAWGREGDHASAAWLLVRIGRVAQDLRHWEEAEEAFRDAVEHAEALSDAPLSAHLKSSLAEIYEAQSAFERAQAAALQALEIRERLGPNSLAVAESLHRLGVLARARSELAAAEAYLRKALAIQQHLGPHSLAIAASLNKLGSVSLDRGDLAAAEDYFRKAFSIGERLVPESLDVAQSLNGLGVVASYRGDLAAAEVYYKRSLAIKEQLVPNSLDVAQSLNNLGLVAYDRGDLATAEDYLGRSLAIDEHLAPNSLGLAASLNNLGLVAQERGDLAAAEDSYRKALAIDEQLAPNSLDVAIHLDNLGEVAVRRGDLAAAEDHLREALAIRERLASDSLVMAETLSNLGEVARDRGDLTAAENYLSKAFAIQESVAPNSLTVADSLNEFGLVAHDRGDMSAAEDYFRKALTIRQRVAPNSLYIAETLNDLGRAAYDRGDLAAAGDAYRGALAIYDRLAPDGLAMAQTLHHLGTLAVSRGDRAEAAESLRRAINTLEAQLGRLGGSAETQATFRAEHSEIYRDTVRVLIALGREAAHDREAAALHAEAFQVLERSRARSLLALLAERDLVFAADMPGEVESERRRLQADYDRTQAELAELSPKEDAEQVEKSLQHLRDLQRRSEEIRAEVRKLSPRLAALQYPEPLDLTGAQRALDPGTVAVAYSVGKEETDLFLLTATGRFRIETLPVGEEELREEVARLRCLLERPGLLRGLEPEALEVCGLSLEEATPDAAAAAFWAQTEGLYRRLVGPVEAELAPAERLLILPDGPLHRLPFAALVRHPEGEPRQYLVEWKPVHTVLSLTLYEQLRRGRPASEGQPARLAAFGDPVYPQAVTRPASDVADPELRWARARGHRLEPLPASRAEVEAIARLYGADAITGPEATEERAKAVPRETRYLHFAVHGLLDEQFPLNSALALTLPETLKEGEDNGLLQAWEIFERVRVDAELVTLSACESGLGQELGGEGLIGLTRAFQYAGARSVVASLWNVNDPATAALMQRFYGYLKAGRPKDEALRAAQIDVLRGPIEVPGPAGQALSLDASHPFYWAAFQLIGDWR